MIVVFLQEIIILALQSHYSPYILQIVRSTKLVIKFPFIWGKHFVGESNSTDCVPACVAMSAKYWKDKSSLKLQEDIKKWKSYFEKLGVHSPRGTNVTKLKNALNLMRGKTKVSMKFRVDNAQHILDLQKCFEEKPEIPVILFYDRRMVVHNARGPHHASLLSEISIGKEYVKVIDPTSIFRNDPSTHPLNDFLKGWQRTRNSFMLAYPTDVNVRINMRNQAQNQSLEESMT